VQGQEFEHITKCSVFFKCTILAFREI